MSRSIHHLSLAAAVLGIALAAGPAGTASAAEPAPPPLAGVLVGPGADVSAQAGPFGGPRGDAVELEDALIRIEVNATDGDAGFQIFVDGEGYTQLWVYAPQGGPVFMASARGGIAEIGGVTELFLETEEPEYQDADEYEELIHLLPEGEYEFWAKLAEGGWATATAELTYDVPDAPEVLAPVPTGGDECATGVSADGFVIDWEPVTTGLFSDEEVTIERYQVIVENDETELEYMVEVPADVTEVSVPPEFLEPGAEYAFEILAVEESGNQTITEVCFVTAE